MNNDIFAFSATEVGYNHTKINKVCEDASDFYDDDDMHICVVADGHGSDNYPRTDRGSGMAVNSAIKCTVDFVKKANPDDVLLDEKHGFSMLIQLAKSILMDWHNSVELDYENNPFTESELSIVSEKYKKRYLDENSENRRIEKAYGCTLIIFAVTEWYSFGMQIGDGKCIYINCDGDFSEPIPWDDNCQLNVTTSICDDDSIDEFRFFITNQKPAAVFCGSDGIDDSYANINELYALYRSILKIFADHGVDVGKNEIKEYLPVLTKKGSGDDVSIGLIMDYPCIIQLLEKFNMQADLFSINETLTQKKQQLSANIEKDNALSARIKKWLDSGNKRQTDGFEDESMINDLRCSREELEKEIKELEIKISEIEDKLIQFIKPETIEKSEDIRQSAEEISDEKTDLDVNIIEEKFSEQPEDSAENITIDEKVEDTE